MNQLEEVRGVKSWKSDLPAIMCVAASIILMALPYGVAMTFAPGPDEHITLYFSYFSGMPIGYGNWLPLITEALSILSLILLFVDMKEDIMPVVMGCLLLVFISTIISWLVFNAFSSMGLFVLLLQFAAFVFQGIKWFSYTRQGKIEK